MAQAARIQLENNGVARSIAFPNRVRDVRHDAGFGTLRDFDAKVDVSYNRLAKIERGEVVPTPEEILGIAEALSVPVGRLLIDTTSPDFDREKWARDHVEASLQHRGGDLPAMILGAAMRTERITRRLSTTDLKDFGLPAATASRIENADRPLDRWDLKVKKSIAKLMGAPSFAEARKLAERRYRAGDLDAMLKELFSPEKIRARENKKVQDLLKKLPGKEAESILSKIEAESQSLPEATRITSRGKAFSLLAANDAKPEPVKAPAERRPARAATATLAVMGVPLPGGRIGLEDAGSTVARPDGAGPEAIAIRMVKATLGPGLPAGSILIADPAQTVSAGDLIVVMDADGGTAMAMASEDDGNGGIRLVSSMPRLSIPMGDLDASEKAVKVVTVALG